jgi:hypothetical protein
MKHLLYTALFFGLIFTACERPYDIKLDEGRAQYTIDAFVNTLDTAQTIRITRSIPFTADPSTIPGVSGAQVALIDSTEFKVHFFQDQGNGNYVWIPNRIAGDTLAIGHSFVLAVAIGTDTFISATQLRPTAIIDSLAIVTEPEDRLGIKAGRYVELWAKDLPGMGDCYRIKTFVNGKLKNTLNDLNLAYDGAFSPNAGTDGIEFIVPIRYVSLNDFQNPYQTGDLIRVEVHSISPEALYFFTEIRAQAQNAGLFATIPSNVKSNIFNLNPRSTIKANGFFCVSATNVVERVIP